jgi:uracil-DNA glycosylase
MDAREQLRRYLEQRREMGERELILDGMSVEDVMRILGAGAAGAAAGAAAMRAPSRNAERGVPAPPANVNDPGSAREPRDARDVAEGASDWREVLRAAGSAPAQPIARAPEARPVEPPITAREASPPEREPAAPPASPANGASANKPPSPATPPATPPGEPPTGIVVGTASRELFGGPLTGVQTLDALAEVIAKCTRCPLYRTATNPVPGEGSPTAELVCVGEAPGETEDRTGRPFVGQAGQLLTKILAAINLSREDVFICNVLKHRPPGNRNPNPQEVEACSPYLVRQLEIIRPKVIVAFGTFAAQTLLETKLSIGKLRGQVHRYYGVPLVVTYHPAALLRNPAWKRPTWEDVQLARRVLDRAAGA